MSPEIWRAVVLVRQLLSKSQIKPGGQKLSSLT